MEEIHFSLGDKLPTVYDAAITIFSICITPTSSIMTHVISQYAVALKNVWEKAFGSDHVLCHRQIKSKLTKVVKDYHNKVYLKHHRKSAKKKINGEIKPSAEVRESIRSLNKKWRLMNKNNNLFDIGKDTKKLTGRESAFYIDQLTKREGRLSEEIDMVYETEQQNKREEQAEQQQVEEEEEEFILSVDNEVFADTNDPDSEYVMNSTMNDSSTLNDNVSTNRSGHVRIKNICIDVSVQTDAAMPDRPKLRIKLRTSTDQIKTTCAKLSSICGLSVEMARKVVQIVCKELYGHDMYLSANEQLFGEHGIILEEKDEKGHIPVSASELKNLTYVIPSSRTITDYKQIQASEMETMAAKALHRKDNSVKSFVHFDTTSRSNIDGEWPSIILRFSDGEEFRLRPLFFAYEDREQITELFAETFKRLSAALSVTEGGVIKPSDLWEKVDALMTDSVTKNLNIEETIPASLESTHRPYHLLCKSHTVEAIDRSNLEVLSSIEKKVNQQAVFESINPALRSFFRGKTALVEAGIDALLTLITHNKSANSCSQADLFDHICERENVSKRVFLYQQRRFAKLGKAASSILQAIDILTMLLDEVEGTNQLVESCRIYLASELFITELRCLSFFNHHVTFPFLNCVECSSQEELLHILPKLYEDLLEKQINTLKSFVVSIHGMPLPEVSTEVEKEIVNLMCTSAAEAILRQCGREYGFSKEQEPLRATDLSTLSSHELEGLPTNNCISERDLSRFDKEAKVSRCRNRKFKAKNIRNNMVLYKSKSKVLKVNRISQKIALILADRETVWNEKQQMKLKERLELKLRKAQKAKDYTKKLLQDCKSWGGPCTTVDELHQVLVGKDTQNRILKTEMAYYAHTHKADKIARKQLFRINGITYEEMLENLTILLDDEGQVSTSTIANLPTNEDVMQSLQKVGTETLNNDKDPSKRFNIQVNEMYVVAWQDSNNRYEWFIGYVKSVNANGVFIVDHLHRVLDGSHTKWKYPSREDVQTVQPEQIVQCDIQGQWDYAPDSRKRLFSVTNVKTIYGAFHKYVNN